jgi:hypothetical protein
MVVIVGGQIDANDDWVMNRGRRQRFLQLLRELRQIMWLEPIDLHDCAGLPPTRSNDCHEVAC